MDSSLAVIEESQHGQLRSPSGTCVDSTNTVYVTDENHPVFVYTSSGQFIECFGIHEAVEWRGRVGSPKGLVVDNTIGALYACV